MFPINLADIGQNNIIKKVGGSPEIKKHLEDLGFVAGGNIRLINILGDNVIVNIKDARIALSGDMARKIMV